MSRGTSRRWVFTINNFTPEDQDRIRAFGNNDRVVYAVFGRETAESGTPHLQGFIIFSYAQSLQACRRLISEQGHYERARGTSQQASRYCKKDGDFEEIGTLPTQGGRRTDIDEVVEWARTFSNDNGRAPTSPEIAREYPSAYIRFPRMSRTFLHLAPSPVLEHGDLREWQRELERELTEEPDDRTIHFFVDSEGGKGKSWFGRWLLTMQPEAVQLIGIGKRDDMAHAINENRRIFIINVPRGQMEFLQYSVLEMIKDRVVFTNKYNSRTKVLAHKAHVIVMCNEYPDMNKMSSDRYHVTEL